MQIVEMGGLVDRFGRLSSSSRVLASARSAMTSMSRRTSRFESRRSRFDIAFVGRARKLRDDIG